MLDVQMLENMPPDTVFARGEIENSPEGIFMTRLNYKGECLCSTYLQKGLYTMKGCKNCGHLCGNKEYGYDCEINSGTKLTLCFGWIPVGMITGNCSAQVQSTYKDKE